MTIPRILFVTWLVCGIAYAQSQFPPRIAITIIDENAIAVPDARIVHL